MIENSDSESDSDEDEDIETVFQYHLLEDYYDGSLKIIHDHDE